MKKSAIMFIAVLVVICGLTATANAGWYHCVVYKIVSFEGGAVEIHFLPGQDETSFADTVRGRIKAVAVGGNKMMATLLTAQTLNWEVGIWVDDVLSWDFVQDIHGVSLIAP